jgi:hypothetical protein
MKTRQNKKWPVWLAGLCLCLGALPALAAPPVDWPVLNTNIVSSTWKGDSQGWAFDGKTGFDFTTGAIYRHSAIWWKLAVVNMHPFAGLTGYNHLGAGTYFQGKLYASMEGWHGCGQETNQSIGVFDATNLHRISVTLVTNYQDGVAAVTVMPDQGTNNLLIAASYCDGAHLFEYTLPDLRYVKTVTLSQTIPEIQGIGYRQGLLIVDADSGPWGLIYAINPATGEVHHLATITAPGANEYEGLDVSQGDLRIAEAGTQCLYFYNFAR